MLHPGLHRRLHGGAVLHQTLARFQQGVGADQQQAVGAAERLGQRVGPVEVGGAHGHALGGEVGQRLGLAAGGDDAGRVDIQGVQQVAHDGATEMTGRAGDEQGGGGHGNSLAW